MRTIGVVTVARSDSGIYYPLLKAIQAAPDLELCLIVAASHFSPEFGNTYRDFDNWGIPISEKVEMTLSSDTPEAIAKSMGLGMISFAQVYSRLELDLLVVLGDRYEMLAAAAAAVPFTIPLAHLHGGEVTEGAMDEAFRHSITKMSHLHFTSTERYSSRVAQLGENPAHIHNVGAPSLDGMDEIEFWSKRRLEEFTGLDFDKPVLLVTLHPVTLEFSKSKEYCRILLTALERVGIQVVITYPNADTNGRVLIKMIDDFVELHPWASAVSNFGREGYFSMMRHAAAMVGNSSSGIIESGSFALPTVNIGIRQRGRQRGSNVIDVDFDVDEIHAAILKATSTEFRDSICGMINPYGNGTAVPHIIDVLNSVSLDESLICKHFFDL
jgi:UDP-hydrolysing UDP-N-acetyl-D-glucosamine 2-epimerase